MLAAFQCAGASVTLAWDPPDNGEVVTYTIYINSDGELSEVRGITGLEYTATNLVAGSKYMFQIAAENDFGESPRSNVLSMVASDPVEIEIPILKPPTNIVSTGTLFGSSTNSWTLGLKWTDQNTNGIGFVVRSRDSEGVILKELKTAGSSIQLAKIPFHQTNLISIAAYDSLGNESPESEQFLAVVKKTITGLRSVKYESVFQLPNK